MIDAYTAKGAVCIIENYDINGTYPEANPVYDGAARYPSIDEMVAWWKQIANTYKNQSSGHKKL